MHHAATKGDHIGAFKCFRLYLTHEKSVVILSDFEQQISGVHSNTDKSTWKRAQSKQIWTRFLTLLIWSTGDTFSSHLDRTIPG